MPRAWGRIRLNIGPPSTRHVDHHQVVQIRRPAILGVGQGAVEHLLQHPRAALRLVPEDVQGLVGQLAPNQVGQRANLAGADPRKSVYASYAIFRYRSNRCTHLRLIAC